MKKILSILLIALLIASTAYAVQPGYRKSPGVGNKLGFSSVGGYPEDSHKIFRLVRWMPIRMDNDASGLSADSIVIWDVNSDDGVTVTETETSRDTAVAGIIVVDALTPDAIVAISDDVSKRSWTWLQTYGPCEMDIGANPIAVKEAVGCASTAAKGDWVSADQTGSWTTTVGIAGFAMNAGPANGTTRVFLRLD